MKHSWYLQHEGREVGPITSKRLKELAEARQISRSTNVRSERSRNWIKAGNISGLFPPDNLIPNKVQSDTKREIERRDVVRSENKKVLILLAVCFGCAGCFFFGLFVLAKAGLINSVPNGSFRGDGQSPSQIDARVVWDNVGYYGLIKKQPDGSWLESDKNTGQLRHKMSEVARTPEYIEVHNPKRSENYRLYFDRMESVVNGSWLTIGGGAWIDATGKPLSQPPLRSDTTNNVAVEDESESESTSNSVSSGATLGRGEIGRIAVPGEEYVWVGTSEKAYSQLNSFASKNNREAIIQLIRNGGVMACPAGTRITVLDPGIFTYEILIMEGQCKGRTGIVASEWIQELN